MKCHVYKAKDGYRWRLKARNGRIIAESGEAYSSRGNATKGWNRVYYGTIYTKVVQDKE